MSPRRLQPTFIRLCYGIDPWDAFTIMWFTWFDAIGRYSTTGSYSANTHRACITRIDFIYDQSGGLYKTGVGKWKLKSSNSRRSLPTYPMFFNDTSRVPFTTSRYGKLTYILYCVQHSENSLIHYVIITHRIIILLKRLLIRPTLPDCHIRVGVHHICILWDNRRILLRPGRTLPAKMEWPNVPRSEI